MGEEGQLIFMEGGGGLFYEEGLVGVEAAGLTKLIDCSTVWCRDGGADRASWLTQPRALAGGRRGGARGEKEEERR